MQRLMPKDSFAGAEGNLANIKELEQKLRERGTTGILVGGCLTGDMPRKDIDIVVPPLADEDLEAYDLWTLSSGQTMNRNDIVNYNFITIYRKALAMLPPGLHVVNGTRKGIRQDLPVTSYRPLEELAKQDESILKEAVGKNIFFKADGGTYVGTLASLDDEFVIFDNLVDLENRDESDLYGSLGDGEQIALIRSVLPDIGKIVEEDLPFREIPSPGAFGLYPSATMGKMVRFEGNAEGFFLHTEKALEGDWSAQKEIAAHYEEDLLPELLSGRDVKSYVKGIYDMAKGYLVNEAYASLSKQPGLLSSNGKAVAVDIDLDTLSGSLEKMHRADFVVDRVSFQMDLLFTQPLRKAFEKRVNEIGTLMKLSPGGMNAGRTYANLLASDALIYFPGFIGTKTFSRYLLNSIGEDRFVSSAGYGH